MTDTQTAATTCWHWWIW